MTISDVSLKNIVFIAVLVVIIFLASELWYQENGNLNYKTVGFTVSHPDYSNLETTNKVRSGAADDSTVTRSYEHHVEKHQNSVVSILDYIEDETLLDQSDIDNLIDDEIEGVVIDPDLIYTYLDDYIYSDEAISSELYLTVVMAAGDYGRVKDYIFTISQYGDSRTLEKLCSLASAFLRSEDKLSFFELMGEHYNTSPKINMSIISLIDSSWDGIDHYIDQYIFPSIESDNYEESYHAMITILKLSDDVKYSEQLYQLSEVSDIHKRDLVLTALEYGNTEQIVDVEE